MINIITILLVYLFLYFLLYNHRTAEGSPFCNVIQSVFDSLLNSYIYLLLIQNRKVYDVRVRDRHFTWIYIKLDDNNIHILLFLPSCIQYVLVRN